MCRLTTCGSCRGSSSSAACGCGPGTTLPSSWGCGRTARDPVTKDEWRTIDVDQRAASREVDRWYLLTFRWRARMRTFIFALAAIVPALCVIDRAAADELPTYDIARNCSEEIGTAGIGGVKPCNNDEKDAKDQLTKRWSQYDPNDKKFCVWREQHWRREELCRAFDLPRNV